MTEQITELQDIIIQDIYSYLNRDEYVEIVINIEVKDTSEQLIFNDISFFVYRETSYNMSSIRLSRASKQMFGKLRTLYKEVKEAWSTCELIIDAEGNFSFDFFYEEPKRLNGKHDFNSYDRLQNYLDKYK